MTNKNLRKRTNLVMVRNAAPRLLSLIDPEPPDYRKLSVALSSAPLEGLVGDLKVQREKQERELGITMKREKEYLPQFDDLYR